MSDSDVNTYAYEGMQRPGNDENETNVLDFVARRIVNKMNTAQLVKVQKVSVTPGAVGAAGTVDVLPLVNQLDGHGNAIKHQKVYKIPYFRYGGGNNAVIIDPEVGSIGLAVIADRDHSQVKRTKDQSNPGSRRRFDMADGMFISLFLAGTPNQYITFRDNGLEIHDKYGHKIVFDSGGVHINS